MKPALPELTINLQIWRFYNFLNVSDTLHTTHVRMRQFTAGLGPDLISLRNYVKFKRRVGFRYLSRPPAVAGSLISRILLTSAKKLRTGSILEAFSTTSDLITLRKLWRVELHPLKGDGSQSNSCLPLTFLRKLITRDVMHAMCIPLTFLRKLCGSDFVPQQATCGGR